MRLGHREQRLDALLDAAPALVSTGSTRGDAAPEGDGRGAELLGGDRGEALTVPVAPRGLDSRDPDRLRRGAGPGWPGRARLNAGDPMESRIERLCVERGLKMTGQRRVIARVLSEASDHPDVEELYRRASALDQC